METAHTSLRRFWPLDPAIDFLNHGSFGATPTAVLEAQSELRLRLEREPVRFMTRELPPLLDAARAALAAFVSCDAADLAFVNNATTGVNTVLRSLDFAPGDEILVTDQGYNACNNAARYVAERAGGRLAIARVPFPLRSPDEVVAAIERALTPRTKLAIVDHVTSATALVFPVEKIVPMLAARGIDTIVDGAHVPGMLDVNVDALGAAYYTGNCHKWLCAPKGAAFLQVRKDRQERIHPLVISHGANAPLASGRTRFRAEFDWTGTDDPTAFLCVPHAIEHVGSLLDGGWPAIRARNHALAVEAQRLLCEALGIARPAPAEMLGSMAAAPVPGGDPARFMDADPLHVDLFAKGIEVPVFPWPAPGHRVLRVACPIYVSADDLTPLVASLRTLG